MRIIEGMNPYTQGLGIEQSLALQQAALERRGRRSNARNDIGTMASGMSPLETTGDPNLSDFGLGAFGQAAAQRLWERSTEEVDPATKLRMWRRS